ncbi:heavy-metal-associated domain-containing protein [Polaromonas sp.]|uniref:heavy-metal-associated domain-containing protein n=1 Tax=Polaromonas sp. TaxID=1869339 RepID=UPI00272F75A9|nr:heavy metal-associated domain-containing protein [Polaromonas sp.]MDP1742392.1 heavy metal-associated domain-containing protein [Polaromonas sp.]
MEAVELKVDGMTCGSCVNAVSRALSAVPGVETVDVGLETGIATVRGGQVTEQVKALLGALATAGYSARAAGAPHAPPIDNGCARVRPAASGCCCGH